MKVIIEIECDNAAFEDDFYKEFKRILRAVPEKVAAQAHRKHSICNAPEIADVLIDINGNTVGSVKVVP
jgi:hypothetical protein